MNIMKRRNGAFSYDDGVDALIDRSITRASTQATTIRANAFNGCTQLEEVNAPNCTSIGNSAFENCTSLTSIDFPEVESTGNYAFRYSGIIEFTEESCPKWNRIGSAVFSGCQSLTRIYAPNKRFGQQCFMGCSALQTAVFAGHNSYNYQFYNCQQLQKVDMTGSYNITQWMFSGTALDTLILRSTSLIALGNLNAFDNTPFSSGGTGGTIYIPKVLYDELGTGSASDYKAATNWSTVDGYGTITWAQIEGSQYEHYYVDGTPIET